MWAQVVNGKVTNITDNLPSMYQNVTGFNFLPIDRLSNYGFFPYSESKPSLNKYQYYLGPEYMITSNSVTAVWKAVNTDLLAAQKQASSEVSLFRKNLQLQGFVSRGQTWQTDDTSCANMTAAVLTNFTGNIAWKTSTGFTLVSQDTLGKILIGIVNWKNSLYAKEKYYLEIISSTNSIDSLSKIDYTTGWPVNQEN